MFSPSARSVARVNDLGGLDSIEGRSLGTPVLEGLHLQNVCNLFLKATIDGLGFWNSSCVG